MWSAFKALLLRDLTVQRKEPPPGSCPGRSAPFLWCSCSPTVPEDRPGGGRATRHRRPPEFSTILWPASVGLSIFFQGISRCLRWSRVRLTRRDLRPRDGPMPVLAGGVARSPRGRSWGSSRRWSCSERGGGARHARPPARRWPVPGLAGALGCVLQPPSASPSAPASTPATCLSSRRLRHPSRSSVPCTTVDEPRASPSAASRGSSGSAPLNPLVYVCGASVPTLTEAPHMSLWGGLPVMPGFTVLLG